MSSIYEIKVVVCGGPNTGKTSFVKRFLDGDFEEEYYPTLGVEVHPLCFNTNKGYIQFNVWDCAGQDHLRGLGDGYYVNAKCAIVFVDNNGIWKESIRGLRAVKHDIPIVLVHNKVDIDGFISWNEIIHDEVATGYQRIEMSSKGNMNIAKPFLHLARAFKGEDLVFLENNSTAPVATNDSEVVDYFEEQLRAVYKM